MSFRDNALRVAQALACLCALLIAVTASAEEDPASAPADGAADQAGDSGDLFSIPIGQRSRVPTSLRLIDVGASVLVAAGSSSESNDAIPFLQGGEHDPRQRGFTLQQVELSLQGAVDPFFTGDIFVVYFLDEEGESRFELEEAFATTLQLPFGLDDAGFQVEAGTFFTEFGRLNTIHPHFWRWQDQPFVMSRFFGSDGLRGPGFRVGWLAPLPWFSEIHFGMQQPTGETMVSFLANDEVFEERAIGGRPFGEAEVNDAADFTYLARWVNGFDLSDTMSAQLGASAVFGPNGTGVDGRTIVYGGDLVAKWRPKQSDRGWPFVVFTIEALGRRYEADNFSGGGVVVPSAVLSDWGLVSEILWGFRRNWAAGARYEFGEPRRGINFDEDGDPVSAQTDPFRAERHRVSPLIIFHPSEFARIRLQYNYDRFPNADAVGGPFAESVHSVWVGLEFGLGAHPAHAY